MVNIKPKIIFLNSRFFLKPVNITIPLTAIPIILSSIVYAQEKVNDFGPVFKTADSVQIVSHKSLTVAGKPGKTSTKLKIIKDGKPTYTIITEKLTLDKKSVDSLLQLLNTANNDSDMNSAFCFDPHHAIFIFKNKSVSYFGICFDCRRFATSKDIEVNERVLSEKVWAGLDLFFRNRSITYKIPDYKTIK